MPYSKVVLERIRQKVYPNKEELNKSLSLYKNSEPIFERELVKQNLPQELKYLPYAISEMDNRMTGKYGTAGVWGLTISVAVKYGLIVTPLVDERFDIEKSTIVALKYIKDLYDIYSDWWKTIIAFTNSPSGLNSTIIRLKDPNLTIWDIYEKSRLPFSQIIPNYTYSTYIINYMETYDVKIKPTTLPDCSKIQLKNDILLSDLLDKINISDTLFYILNPVFTSSQIPANYQNSLLIPKPKESLFYKWEDSLYVWAIQQKTTFFIPDSLEEIEDDSLFINPSFTDSVSTEVEEIIIEKIVEKPKIKETNKPKTTNQATKIIYTVKSGDMLGKIANKHNVSLDQIKEWNNLKSDKIHPGQKLVIKSKNTSSSIKDKATEKKSKSNKYVYYTVKKGDTLWGIASKYEDVTDDEIKKLNNIGNSIHPGQVLKIKIK